MFSGISLTALAGAAVSLLQELGKRILLVLCFVAVLALVSPLLPNDPFQSVIVQGAKQIHTYYGWLNWFLPLDLISSSMMFYAGYRYAYYLYRKIVVIAMANTNSDIMQV